MITISDHDTSMLLIGDAKVHFF